MAHIFEIVFMQILFYELFIVKCINVIYWRNYIHICLMEMIINI